MRVVDVAVMVPSIDDALTYSVPAALDRAVAVGVRVVVPVGPRRRLVGLVTQVRDRSDVPQAFKLKPIERVLDSVAVVTPEQLALARFVQRYYVCELGAAVSLVMPPDADRIVQRRYSVTDKGERARVFGAALGLSAADALLLARFEPGERKEERRVAVTASQRARMDRLVHQGFLQTASDTEPMGELHTETDILASDGGAPLLARATSLAVVDAWVRAFTAAAAVAPTLSDARAAHADALGKLKRLQALKRVRLVPRPKTQHHAPFAHHGIVHALTDDQQCAARALVGAINARSDGAFLLEGVTGSGKTEVYLEAVRACLAAGRSVLLLVPEIGLTPQLVARVRTGLAGTGHDVALLHSGITATQRATSLAQIRSGAVRVVVGARSALFAPLCDLGLIVVDEEHDGSLKQDETPRYHARDVALWRAKEEHAVIVLGSATPSFESRHNAALGKLVHLRLPTRVGGGGKLPVVELIDLRARAQHKPMRARDTQNADAGSGVVLSLPLIAAINETLANKEQVLLFLNKRGYASAVLCESCGHVVKCPNCSVSMTFHKRRGALLCHQCDHETLVPQHCPDCRAPGMTMLGTGTERVEAELSARFPAARVVRLDRDSTQKRGALADTLNTIMRGDVDIVVGTQMIAKGHDFPLVRTVGVVFADHALALPDFRAAERVFALLLQVAGRAGRGDKRGRVLIQTHDPQHPVLQAVLRHDVEGFSALELSERQRGMYPPFVRALLIRAEAPDPNDARLLAQHSATIVRALALTTSRVLGPAPCPTERLHGMTRMQVFVREGSHALRTKMALAVHTDAKLRDDVKRRKGRLVVDVDPIHLL